MSDEVLSALRLYGKLSWSYHSETKEHAAAFAQVVRHVKAYADAKVAEEREAIAKIVEESTLPDSYSQPVMDEIAQDIRNRKGL